MRSSYEVREVTDSQYIIVQAQNGSREVKASTIVEGSATTGAQFIRVGGVCGWWENGDRIHRETFASFLLLVSCPGEYSLLGYGLDSSSFPLCVGGTFSDIFLLHFFGGGPFRQGGVVRIVVLCPCGGLRQRPFSCSFRLRGIVGGTLRRVLRFVRLRSHETVVWGVGFSSFRDACCVFCEYVSVAFRVIVCSF